MTKPAPIIVSALFDAEDQSWLTGLRQEYFPPERNYLPAHLTLFHHLPPSIEAELSQRLRAICSSPPPVAEITSLLNLGRGVAFRIQSPELQDMRADIADAFATMLTPQDQAGWRPHITIQNKVDPAIAKTLLTSLSQNFRPRPLAIAGLAAWWYRGGPWDPIGAWRFGGGHRMATPGMERQVG